MTDRRLYPVTPRLAHSSLRGQVDVPLTDGEACEIAAPLADLLAAPDGALDRQLVYGEGFCVIDRAADYAFGFARKDGYCGWVLAQGLRPATAATHWVFALSSHLYPKPRVQSPPQHALPFGANVQVLGTQGNFAQTPKGFVPLPHLRALRHSLPDPVTTAEMFLGVPYLWGGNSAAGIDCSGLVQAALLASGVFAPADSDLQQSLGTDAAGSPWRRGDLIFWNGHVGLVVDGARLIHANGHTLSVAYEVITDCIQRIAAAGGGDVTHHRRISSAINQ
jgi:cell wall-associated NlpC family hydrolase